MPATSASTNVTSTSGATPSIVKGADTIIASNKWRFHECYTKALTVSAKDGGEVRVTVVVGLNGDVTSATIASSTASTELAECLRQAFFAMKFAEPEGGTVTFTVPVVLSGTSSMPSWKKKY